MFVQCCIISSRELDRLRNCYHQVFKDGCGDIAADVVDNMMQKAFADPYYLRYKYKPDCSQVYKIEPEMTLPPDGVVIGHSRGHSLSTKYGFQFGISMTLPWLLRYFVLVR